MASASPVPLESILCTEELQRRPSRLPDYETENRALAALIQALADAPARILQTLAETIRDVLKADSAGLSLLRADETSFYWPAIAGDWQPHIGGGTPRDFGPCGDVLDRNAPLLFRHWERRYPYLRETMPLAEEGLLVPFSIDGKAVGTIWAIAHDDRRRFDAEDLRQLESLGRFASAAYQSATFLDGLDEREQALQRSRTQLTDLRNARHAALNLMEDAVQSREAMETLNAQLRDSEDRYRTLFDLGPVAVYSCDAAGVIQQFNTRAAELWGRTPASGDTDERFCGSYKLFRPDGTFMPHAQCPMAEVVSGRIAEVRDEEVLIERPDGSQVTVIVNIRPLQSARGTVTGAINCFYDITERKRSEETVRESERRYRTLVEQVKDYAIFRTDTAGRATSWNEGVERILGFDEAVFIGQDNAPTIFMPEDVRSGAPGRELRTAVAEGSIRYDRWMRRRDGTPFWASGITTSLTDEAGELTGFSKVMRDTTAAKRLEEERDRLLLSERSARQEAEEVNRLKDEFVATVSHELRTPLNAMLGWLRMLRMGALDEDKAARALATVERNAQAQHQLVADLLDVSGMIAGRLRFEPSLIDLVPALGAAIEAVRPAAEAKGVTLHVAVDAAAAPVSGDAARLQQIVGNLLANAVTYTPPGGQIDARLHCTGSEAVIVVRDTGEGISAAFLPHVFGRFRQADGATSRRHGGLGLGLAIVRYLVEAHGGQVTAASEGAGRGAAFTVTLPLLPAGLGSHAADGEDRHQAPVPPLEMLQGLRVLVVDDEADARELVSEALAQIGAEVRAVCTARAALDLLDVWRPAVLVSDIGMPDQDGYDLMREVRALPIERGGQVPAVALTGYANLEGQTRALAAGYQVFVPKPVDVETLAAAIAQLAVKE